MYDEYDRCMQAMRFWYNYVQAVLMTEKVREQMCGGLLARFDVLQ